MAARDELVAAIAGRYAQGDRGERGRILDEFAAVTGFHRKHAMRLLRAGQVTRRCGPRPGRRVHDEAVRADRDLGGIRPDLRQTAAATTADPSRSNGSVFPKNLPTVIYPP
jgi:hypothetical protein